MYVAARRRDRARASGPPSSASGRVGEAHNYRETVSPWFRSLFLLRPDVSAMAAAPWQFHVHVLVGMLLFALWPFTRLVHAFTAPLHYLFRPVHRLPLAGRPAPVAAAPGQPPRLGADRHPTATGRPNRPTDRGAPMSATTAAARPPRST